MPITISLEILQVGVGLLVLGLLCGAWLSGRSRVAPVGYWPMAWAVLVALGGVRVTGLPNHYELPPTVAFWALLVAGAYRYAARPVPRWLVPASLGVVAVEGLAIFGGRVDLGGWISVASAWGGALIAADVCRRAAETRDATLLHRLLPLGFVAVVLLGSVDHFFLSRGPSAISPWLVVGILVATHQAIAVFDRVRKSADAISHQLEESVSTLTSTLEATGEGILVVDNDGRYTSFNRAFGELWQIPDEILERRQSEFALSHAKDQLQDPDEFYATVKELYADREAESFDTLEFKDGRVFERYSRPQRIGDEVVGRVWSFRDVTKRRRAEEEAERYRTHLEELVEERTRELIQSRDKLRQADRMVAIGTLAAGVAHQINNPIGGILNSAEYALLCEDDEQALSIFRDALTLNAAEARRCGSIVRGMLQFARQEPVEKTREDLNQAVRLAIRAVESYAEETGAEIDVDLSGDPIAVLMSLLEMEQVVVNLLRNAIEAASPNAHVRVSTRRMANGAAIEVADDGPGIDETDRGQIFDPFFSTRIMEGGTGLGLSVAHGIVTDHGGRIEVARSDERGTTFTIDLPLPDPDAATT